MAMSNFKGIVKRLKIGRSAAKFLLYITKKENVQRLYGEQQ